MENRKEYLLLQVLKMFKMQKECPYVLSIETMEIDYDDTMCDGYCLCNDILDELGMESLDEVDISNCNNNL